MRRISILLLLALHTGNVQAGEDKHYSDYFKCLESLAKSGALSAPGGTIQDVGNFYLLPANKEAKEGLYVLTQNNYRFEKLPKVPQTPTDDYTLHAIFYDESIYPFNIRYDQGGDTNALGYSISVLSQSNPEMKKKRELSILLRGKDETALPVILKRLETAIPQLGEQFKQVLDLNFIRLTDVLADEFILRNAALLTCEKALTPHHPNLVSVFIVELVELTVVLEQALVQVMDVLGESWQETWTQSLAGDYYIHGNPNDLDAALKRATDNIQNMAKLHDFVTFHKEKAGINWEASLLEEQLATAGVDSITTRKILDEKKLVR